MSDTDGFTSSAILWNYIKSIFPNSRLEFTVHEGKQHGLSDKIDWLVDEEQFDLVVCPDAASFDGEYMRRLGEVGTEVCCIDHHSLPDGYVMEEQTPANAVVVNNQLSPNYANKSLCGAGMVYKFCQVLDNILGISRAEEYLDLAALGEIADVMDRTTSETNYIIMKGLKNIRNGGFKAIIEAQSFRLKEKADYPYVGLTPLDVAFYIGPVINALTRIGTIEEKRIMFYAFIEPDRLVKSTKLRHKEGDTETAAEQTARVGINAKNRQNKIKERALDLIDFKIQKDDLLQNNIIVVEVDENDNIPQELSGLIAMAVVTKYNRPCLIVRRNSEGYLRGSMRSDSNFAGLPSFKDFLEGSGYFEYVAGHAQAAGASINISQLDAFLEYSNNTLSSDAFQSCYAVDYVFDLRYENFIELGKSIARHPEYFGNGINEVKVVVKGISLANILVMGTDKSSIRITDGGMEFVKFKDIDFIEEVMNNRQKKLTVYGSLSLNTYAGRETLQVCFSDYEFEEEDRFAF